MARSIKRLLLRLLARDWDGKGGCWLVLVVSGRHLGGVMEDVCMSVV